MTHSHDTHCSTKCLTQKQHQKVPEVFSALTLVRLTEVIYPIPCSRSSPQWLLAPFPPVPTAGTAPPSVTVTPHPNPLQQGLLCHHLGLPLLPLCPKPLLSVATVTADVTQSRRDI